MSWRDWPTYSAACRRDVHRLLRSGQSLTAYHANPTHGPGPTEGSWAWRLEREAERVHEVPCVVACANGTVALETLLGVLYPHGGEIITTAFTFSATLTAILRAGLTAVFADVELATGLLEVESAKRMMTTRTVNVLTVDLFGRQPRVPIGTLSDSCQSVGLKPVASHGGWSFNGRKNVPAGEGGAMFTSDPDVAGRCRLAIGHAENFTDWASGNGHLNEVTACLAYHGMRKIRQRNAQRTKMAQVLNAALTGAPVIRPDLTGHALYLYPLIVERGMERVADRLSAHGVLCQRGYIQPPLHQYSAFQHLRRDALPNTERLSRDRLLLFPQVTPTATRQEMEELGDTIRKALM